MTAVGALMFGLVVGFITYRTLVRATQTAITDLTAVLAAIGGAGVTALYDPTGTPFAWYSIGLAAGMLTFFTTFWWLNGRKKLAKVMGRADGHGPRA